MSNDPSTREPVPPENVQPPQHRDARTEDDDPPPPMTIAGRGPLGQDVPDVATGSTPATRQDD